MQLIDGMVKLISITNFALFDLLGPLLHKVEGTLQQARENFPIDGISVRRIGLFRISDYGSPVAVAVLELPWNEQNHNFFFAELTRSSLRKK